jgi:hypothetical protein
MGKDGIPGREKGQRSFWNTELFSLCSPHCSKMAAKNTEKENQEEF